MGGGEHTTTQVSNRLQSAMDELQAGCARFHRPFGEGGGGGGGGGGNQLHVEAEPSSERSNSRILM